MALSQSALSELLDAIRAGGSADIMRDAMTLVLQQRGGCGSTVKVCGAAAPGRLVMTRQTVQSFTRESSMGWLARSIRSRCYAPRTKSAQPLAYAP